MLRGSERKWKWKNVNLDVRSPPIVDRRCWEDQNLRRRMNIGSEKFGALQEILPINFYEAKIWISDTFLRKWGDIKVNLTEWYWSKECQDFSEKTTMLEKERCGGSSHIWWGMRVIIFFLTVQFNFLKRFGCTNFIIHSPRWGVGHKRSHANQW